MNLSLVTVWISPVECILIVEISVEEDLMPRRAILEALRSQNNFPVKSFTDLHDGMSINGAEILLKLGSDLEVGNFLLITLLNRRFIRLDSIFSPFSFYPIVLGTLLELPAPTQFYSNVSLYYYIL